MKNDQEPSGRKVGHIVGFSKWATPVIRLVDKAEYVPHLPFAPVTDDERNTIRARYGLGPYPPKQKQLEDAS